MPTPPPHQRRKRVAVALHGQAQQACNGLFSPVFALDRSISAVHGCVISAVGAHKKQERRGNAMKDVALQNVLFKDIKIFALCVMVIGSMSFASPLSAKERGGNYISNNAVDLRDVVPNPPEVGSHSAKTDLDAVIAAQTARTTASVAQAQADRKRSIKAFSRAIGGGFSAERFPLTTALVKAAVDDTRGILGQSKVIWKRERPFRVDRSITACVKEPDTGSYPSSHAASGYVIALVLAKMLPERAIAIHARSEEFANGRLVCGVHYPTDISAGHVAAKAIFSRLMADKRFQADLNKATQELRRGFNGGN